MPNNYAEAHKQGVMWWPINQECAGCVYSKRMVFQDLKDIGIFSDVDTVEDVEYDDENLALLSNRCNLNKVLADGVYTCSSKTTRGGE